MIKIAHFADVHLGITTYGKLDTKTGLNTRVMDFLDTLDCMVDAVREVNPDLILFAGDAHRTREPGITLITHMADIVIRLAEIAPIIAVLGNHDRQKKGDGKRHSIEVWEDLATHNQVIVAQDIHGYAMDDAYIVTLPWFYDKTMDDVFDELDAALAKQPRDNIPTILVGHVAVDGAMFPTGYTYDGIDKDLHLPLDVLSDPELWDYVALGHIHLHQCMNDCPPVVYSGSLDRNNWGERNDPGKGFVVADVEQGNATWEFVDLQVRPMIDIRIPMDAIESLKDRKDIANSILRVTVLADAKTAMHSIHRDVLDALPNTYNYLDGIIVEHTETVVDRRREEAAEYEMNIDPMVMLETWLERRHDDDDYIDDLLDAAYDLIHGEE